MLAQRTSQGYCTWHNTGKTSFMFLTVSTLSWPLCHFCSTQNTITFLTHLKHGKANFWAEIFLTTSYCITYNRQCCLEKNSGRVKFSLCLLHLKQFLPFLCSQLKFKCKQTWCTGSSCYGSMSESSHEGSPCPGQIHCLNKSYSHPKWLAKSTSLSIFKGPVFPDPLSPHIHVIQNLGSFIGFLCTQSNVKGLICTG